MVIYHIVIWKLYLWDAKPSTGFIIAPTDATYVFYGWFIAGVVGLKISLYAMTGLEAGMLMDPAWAVPDAMSLILHADGTWSGPGGWTKTAKRLVRICMAQGAMRAPFRL